MPLFFGMLFASLKGMGKVHIKLKKLEEQCMVITGASSGIGRATAIAAAKRGASVVLSARSSQALEQAVDEIKSFGGRATSVVADVADEQAMERLATTAVNVYGQIDTWVNNAGVSIFGPLQAQQVADMRRLFDVTFWGVVHGSFAALPHLKRAGGALINVGSEVSDVPFPLQGSYAAAKHAVAGFSDTLRIELQHEGAPVSLTLIKPGSIDTPFFEHVRNLTMHKAKAPPPVYEPQAVADAILSAAEQPIREVVVGGAARSQIFMFHAAPAASDTMFEKTMFKAQKGERVDTINEGILFEPSGNSARERGDYEGRVHKHSLYTLSTLRPRSWLSALVGR